MNTTVKDGMTTQVAAVRSGATFKEMATTLRENRVSAFPVLDDVTLVGKPDTSDVGREFVYRVRHVQGVVAVRDCFSYPAPSLSGPTFFPVDLLPGSVRAIRHRRRLPHADRTGRRGVARTSLRLRAQTRGRSVGRAFDSEGYAGGLTFARHHLGGSGLVSCSLAVSRTVSSSSPYRAFSIFAAATTSPAGIHRHQDSPAARPPEPASLTSSPGREPAPAQRPLASAADPDPSRCYPAVGAVTVPGPRERNGDQGCA